MRILFFSDAHGNEHAVRAFLKKSEDTPHDLMIYGGDSFGYYFGADSVISLIRERADVCLLGNHDRMMLDVIDRKRDASELIKKYGDSYRDFHAISPENIDFLRSLESRYELRSGRMRMVFVHGSIEDPLDGRIYPDAVIEDESKYEGIDYVFCGHTHHKMVKRAGGCFIVNPGSIGQQRDGKGISYIIFDTETGELTFHIVDYDRASAEREAERCESDPEMRGRLIEAIYRKCIKRPEGRL
ncbi:MAG: metallophosphatase family protein [Lachnospiraceae bacterium]|nr:metallophosphatase family protein [Lachnospiraceae bacterium]